MEMTSWIAAFGDEFSNLVNQTAAYLPRLLIAIAILIAGWLVAKLLRMLGVRLLIGLDHLWHRFISRRGLEQLQPHFPPARIAGEILFWFALLFFIAGAASILGLGTFVTWLSTVATYIPILLTGLLIILTGVIIGALLRDVVTSTCHKAGIVHSELLGRITQIAVLITAGTVGIDQMGIDITFLTVIMGVALATTFGGMALAFGIGARTYMSNVIAGHQLRQLYQIGDRIQIREYEGTVIELTPTKVILNTARGRVVVPAGLFEQETSILPEKGTNEGE